MTEPTPDLILEYLASHPDFLERHIGSALWKSSFAGEEQKRSTKNKIKTLGEVRLVSYQDKIATLEAQVAGMYRIAAKNQALIDKIIHLDQALLAASGLKEVLAAIRRELRDTFNLPCHTFKLLPGAGTAKVHAKADYWICNNALAKAVKSLKTPLSGSTLAHAQFYEWLGSANPNDQAESFLQLPLAIGGQTFGVLLIGHSDPDYFTPDAPLDYVAILADSVAITLNRWLKLV